LALSARECQPVDDDTTKVQVVKVCIGTLSQECQAEANGVTPGSLESRGAPMQEPIMRTLGFRTHVLLTLLACGGLLAALGMSWSASGPERESEGTLDHALEGLGRVVGAADGIAAREALGGWAVLLTSLAVLTAVTAVLCMLAVAHGLSRELLRLSALAILGIVAWKMIDPPGDELRRGALVAAASALVLVASAFAVASTPLKRRRGPRFGHPGVFVPPPAPPRWDPNDSVGPPLP
jgi:hypothetical protein